MIDLRFMDSSGSRDSTTAALDWLLDWLLAAAIATTVLVATAGIDFRIAGVTVRSHSWMRISAAAIALLLVRYRFGFTYFNSWLLRITVLTAICGSIATWFRFLLTTIGGADSWGYVSASELIRHGRLIEAMPIAEWLSASNRLAIASPLGWAPAPNGSGIVPTYPLGLPSVMALFSKIGGSDAVFYVAPIAGLITLRLVYKVARDWYDADTALLAVAIAAWNPVFIAYAKQPMSDMLATMWAMLALWLALRVSPASALAAGLAAGAAVITRPVLLIAALLIPFASHRGDSARQRFVLSGIGLGIGVVVQMTIQYHLFGSPIATGYGSAGNLFSVSNLGVNVKIYGGYLWSVLGVLWIVALWIGIMAARPDPRSYPALIFAAVLFPYLLYLPFDDWETLRFLLPGLVPLSIVVADGWGHIARLPKKSIYTTVMVFAFIAFTAWRSEDLLRRSSAWDISDLESRYPLAGEWINVNTPQNSVVLANQHSGSLRWYGKRQTLRWDFIDPPQLAVTVHELQSHGATVFVALEGAEEKMFDDRFAGVIGQLQVDPVGRVRNVTFLRLK